MQKKLTFKFQFLFEKRLDGILCNKKELIKTIGWNIFDKKKTK